MNLFSTRSDRCALRCGFAAACCWLAVAGVTIPVQGQCTPQELVRLTASDAAAFDNFGSSVSISGDTAVIGAYADDHAGWTDAGSAYVFVRSGTVWSEQAKLIASDAAAHDSFGNSVSISGDTAVVGAWYHDDAGGTDAGSAYVFAAGDGDNDSVIDACDNCPQIYNPGQEDSNGDGIGDVCPCPQRGDMNGDGVIDGTDVQLFVQALLNQ